jgi:hypothetical protein
VLLLRSRERYSSISSFVYLRPNLLYTRKFVIVLLGLLLLPWRSDRPATA